MTVLISILLVHQYLKNVLFFRTYIYRTYIYNEKETELKQMALRQILHNHRTVIFSSTRNPTCTCRSLQLASQNTVLTSRKLSTRNFYQHHGTLIYCKRTFKTSATSHAAPVLGPLLVKLSTPLSRLAFVLFGRRVRNWWANLPPERKNRYLSFISKSRHRFIVGMLGFGGLSMAYYYYHLEETPVTGRKRFMILNDEQLKKIAMAEWKMLDDGLEKLKLPIHHPLHKKVYNIVHRILSANRSKEVASYVWEVNVVKNDDEVNAFVLANGQIYVYTGMLNAVANEHELAGILGHEISHAILNHSAEMLSLSGFFNIYSSAIVALLWAFIPTDGFALLASLFQNFIEDLLINLPYSRKLEKEADEVGLLLAARACYDIRHVPMFWNRMQNHAEFGVKTGKTDWLSTHPTNESRVKWLESVLPDALALRREFKCPRLKEFLELSRYMTH